MNDSSVNIDAEYLPESFLVAKKVACLAKKLVTSRRNVSYGTGKAGIDFVVLVAKECSLTHENQKHIKLLADVTSCDQRFAEKSPWGYGKGEYGSFVQKKADE